GVSIGSERIQAMVGHPQPSNIKEVRSVLGAFNYVRRFIRNYSDIVSPLVTLTRREFAQARTLSKAWTPVHTQAFTAIKHMLTTAPILRFPDLTKPFTVHTDASLVGMGGMLTQGSEDNLAIVAYFSKQFSNAQQRYSVTAKECYAVVLALDHWRPYLFGRHFTVVTDHQALRYLYSMSDTSSMLTWWSLMLQSFNFTVIH
ncbi:unnamed protein product, partial [Laminaria digitata]